MPPPLRKPLGNQDPTSVSNRAHNEKLSKVKCRTRSTRKQLGGGVATYVWSALQAILMWRDLTTPAFIRCRWNSMQLACCSEANYLSAMRCCVPAVLNWELHAKCCFMTPPTPPRKAAGEHYLTCWRLYDTRFDPLRYSYCIIYSPPESTRDKFKLKALQKTFISRLLLWKILHAMNTWKIPACTQIRVSATYSSTIPSEWFVNSS